MISNEKRIEIAVETKNQYLCQKWYSERKIRLTSSSCHPIKTVSDNNMEHLALKTHKNIFAGNEATRYGQKMENLSKEAFMKDHREYKLLNIGLVVDSSNPWICCSPDALLLSDNETVLMEIKCPFSRKNKLLVDQIRPFNVHVPYLQFVDQTLKLKCNHPYYTQIQLSLFVLRLQKCFLIVYSEMQYVVIEVLKDNMFISELLPKLEKFYFLHKLPLLVQ